MAGTEQDPYNIPKYSLKNGINLKKFSPNQVPGIGILVDPARLISNNPEEKKNPYYLSIGDVRVYGPSLEGVVNSAKRADLKNALKGKKEISTTTTLKPNKLGSFFGPPTKKVPANQGSKKQGSKKQGSFFGPPTKKVPANQGSKKVGKTRKGPPSQKEIAAARALKKAKQAPQTNDVDLRGFQSNNSNLFETADAPAVAQPPVKKSFGMTAAEAIASRKGRVPNQAARNAAAGQKLLQARAAILKKQKAAIPRNTSKIENFKPEGKVPNSFYNEPAGG